MTFTTAKLTEMPLRTSFPPLSLFSSSPHSKPSFHSLKIPFSSSSSSIKKQNSTTWLAHWAPPRHSSSVDLSNKVNPSNGHHHNNNNNNNRNKTNSNKSQNAIERIVLRLRNLGLTPEEDEQLEVDDSLLKDDFDNEPKTEQVEDGEKLGDLLKREWIRPDTILSESDDEDGNDDDDDVALPWERERNSVGGEEREKGRRGLAVKAPTLAELTMEDEELRRLRRDGMYLRERISVAKAGITKEVLEKIHDKWRKQELIRLKFHEVLARDMKTAHEITERRTGGLVIWRSGSVMVVYRGSNYEGPLSKSKPAVREGDVLFVPDVSLADNVATRTDNEASSTPDSIQPVVARADRAENMSEEEAEYNKLLDGLGPRFEEWWGTGVLPVDADLLPPKVPGYKTPFRLLPTGMRSRLTNAEMTNMRKLAKSLPCHFALGRNRNHQGLAVAIIKLWEKSLIAKIAVKRGIQNTNNKLMADELKNLTGGVLLLRNKYFIVIYRGKDFLPTSVAATLAERQELTKQIQDDEEKVRRKPETAPVGVGASSSGEDEDKALAGTLAEFYEAQARWGREVSTKEREKMIEEAAKAQRARLVKRIEHKLAVAQAKKLRAERLLSKIEASMIPSGPDYDQETITDEERAMFRRVGLRMKAYLPLGVRGVFDGVIENMHLHWKHRELVKLLSKQKTLAFVEDTARLLEYESGGILVAIERVSKGFAIIYYRGKNYRRPLTIRPRNLLTKAKALKRSVAMQRHEALSQHISELEKTIKQMKKEIGVPLEDEDDEGKWDLKSSSQLKLVSESTPCKDEASDAESDWEDEDDSDNDGGIDSEADADFEFVDFEDDDRV